MDRDGAYDHKWALKFDECVTWFKHLGMNPFPSRDFRSLACNATWDGVMCWPAISAGTKYTMACPPEDGFSTTHNVTKHCHYSGRWTGKDKDDFSLHQGWTDYSPCYIQKEEIKIDTSRVVEHVGLALSIIAITAVLFLLICSRSRRWRLNQARIGFLASLLLMYIVRLCLHVDEEFAQSGGSLIHDKQYVCEGFIAVLEFFKFLVGGWLAATCFHGLFETISERRAERCLCVILYAVFAFAYAIICVIVWLCLLLFGQHDDEAQFVCFGHYKMRTPSAYVLVYGNLVLLALAFVCAITHGISALFKRCIGKTSRFAGVRWFLQSLIHLAICTCLLAVWYYDLWLKSQHTPDDDVFANHAYVDVATIAFSGFLVAALIGLAQCCLPAKETMRL